MEAKENKFNNDINSLITLLIRKTKTDNELNKFISLCLRFNILIYENIDNKWIVKKPEKLIENINKVHENIYNEFKINTVIKDEYNYENELILLDKNIYILKKKLNELYELRRMLENNNIYKLLFKISEIEISETQTESNFKTIICQNDNRIKVKRMFSTDIYIEEFSN
jgi:hypothetical protein